MSEAIASEPILSVRNLVVEFESEDGPVRVIDDVSFDAFPNEALCIVGESSSGKSVTMLAVMGLLPPNARIVSGQILFRGRDMATFTEKEWRRLRGGELGIVFQDPLTALNPVMRIGAQIAEAVRLHARDLDRRSVRLRVLELLEQVHVPDPGARYRAYPHQFSGGMRQRVMIAMAMAHTPALLIADEPTTALDVTIQEQVLEVLRDMRERAGSALVLITHDLGVVAENADRVVVIYCGRVVETGAVDEVFSSPRHPYTAGLMASVLRLDDEARVAYAIPGTPPQAALRPEGCPFHTRCGMAELPRCSQDTPAMEVVEGERLVACHFSERTSAWVDAELPRPPGLGPTARGSMAQSAETGAP